jgi:hypothetical protein
MSQILKVTGEILSIGEVLVISDKFKKLEFSVEVDGEYPKKHLFTITQNRVEQLKGFKPGDDVEICFNLNGYEYEDKKTGSKRIINTTEAWSVKRMEQKHEEKPKDDLITSNEIDDDLPF